MQDIYRFCAKKLPDIAFFLRNVFSDEVKDELNDVMDNWVKRRAHDLRRG